VQEFEAEFIGSYASANNKPSEVESKKMIFKHHLIPAFGHRRLDEIDARAIEHYKADKLSEKRPKKPMRGGHRKNEVGLIPKTINNHLTVLSKMLSLAVEWEIIDHAPRIKWLKGPDPEFDFLTFHEADRLRQGADEGLWRTMITTALKTGLRHGELLALR